MTTILIYTLYPILNSMLSWGNSSDQPIPILFLSVMIAITTITTITTKGVVIVVIVVIVVAVSPSQSRFACEVPTMDAQSSLLVSTSTTYYIYLTVLVVIYCCL